MSQAIGDPEELRAFASQLQQFIENLQSESASLSGAFSALGDTWQDEKRFAFEEEYQTLMGQMTAFQEACGEHIPHLLSLADRLEEYLHT